MSAASGIPSDLAPKRPHRGGRIALIALVVVLVLVAVLLVVAEFVVRGIVDRTIADRVEQSLPDGSTGQVHADAHGIVLPQLLGGTLDDVDVSSKRLTVQGVPFAVTATVHDVPVSGTGSTGAIDGRVRLASSAVQDLGILDQVSGDITLRKGGIAWDGTTTILGYDVDYRVLADLAAASNGKGVTVTPQTVRVTDSDLGLDFGGSVPGVSGTPVNLCTATYLPAELRLRSLDITAAASARLSGAHLPLSEKGLLTTGTC